MQKYLFSKIMLLALATSALSTVQAAERISTREKLKTIGAFCVMATNDFAIGFTSGVALGLGLEGCLKASHKIDPSGLLKKAITVPAGILSVSACAATMAIVDDLEEKVAPDYVSEVNKLHTYESFQIVARSAGIVAGVAIVASLFPSSNDKGASTSSSATPQALE